MWPMRLTPLTAAVVAKSAKGGLLYPRPCRGSLGLMQTACCSFSAALFIDCPPRHFFGGSALSLSLSSSFLPSFPPWFFRSVGCSPPTTPRPRHSRLFCLLACDLRAFMSLLQVSRLTWQYPNFAAGGMVLVGNDSALLGCVATGRCCWNPCIV